MATPNIYLFIISFLYGDDSGLAMVSAPDIATALNVLKNSGCHNGDPDGYTIIRHRNAGLYTQEGYELLHETYTNAEVAYDAISDRLDALELELDVVASDAAPMMNGVASPGTSEQYSRADHVHPSDTTKQDVIADLEEIIANAQKGATAYSKFEGGVKKADLSTGVKDSLAKADSAVQHNEISSFITKVVDDLVYYYTKDDTYTKEEVQTLIGSIQHFHFEIYPSLASITNPKDNVLYLIGPTGTGSDEYDEYVYSDGTFVKIGDTSIDLSGYATLEYVNAEFAKKVTSLTIHNIVSLTQAEFNSLSNKSDDTIYIITDATEVPDNVRGIYSVEQTVTSTESGGTNIVTITLTDGTEEEIQIKNGTEPLLTADESGNIYSDGVLLTDVIKNAHDTAEIDHVLATEDRGLAASDHTTAVADHGIAAGDHTTATSDHGTASSDHTTAASDHTIASTDHSTATSDHTAAAADHTLAGTDHQTAAADHTLAGTDHTTAASDHTLASTDHGTAVSDHTQAESDHTRAESDHQSIADKADVDGYYQQMTVGLAENLVDTKGTGTEQVFTRRTSCGDESIADDGTAVFKEVRGNTLVWNQLRKSIPDASKTIAQVSITYSNGVLTLNGTATSTASDNISSKNIIDLAQLNGRAGHKILFYTPGKTSSTYPRIYYGSGGYIGNGEAASIYTIPSGINATTAYLSIRVSNTVNYNNFKIEIKCIIDLTQMFGAGNEPESASEFLALFPNVSDIVNNGQIINNASTKYVTDGFNQWDEVWERGAIDGETGQNVDNSSEIRSTNYIPIFPSTGYYFQVPSGGYLVSFFYDINKNFIEAHNINQTTRNVLTSPANAYYLRIRTYNYGISYKNDININLSWSGYRNGEYEPHWKRELALNLTTITGKLNGEGSSVVVFPDGMKSAGAAYDYGIVENGNLTKLVKVIQDVDLGNWGWTYDSANTRFRTDYVIASAAAGTMNILCMKYTTSTYGLTSNTNYDKIIGVHSSKYIAIRDSSYSDDTTFETSLSGVHLYYERATPEVYVLDTPISMASKVADFGTESIEPSGVDANGVPNTAPFRAVIKYNDDFTRKIATMEKNFTSKETIDSLLTCLGTALNGTITKTWDATNNKWTFTFTESSESEVLLVTK